jgi:hypothetical protein
LYFGDTQLKSWLVLPAILTGFMVFFSLSKWMLGSTFKYVITIPSKIFTYSSFVIISHIILCYITYADEIT